MGVLVDETGRVGDAKIMTSSGDAKFDSEALSTVKKWKFKPSICDGKATPVYVAVEMKSSVD